MLQMQPHALLLLLWVSATLPESYKAASFHKTTGVDCVSSSFFSIVSGVCVALECGVHCVRTEKCQAFRLIASGTCECKLFLFDACSHRVQSVPNCTNQVTVYLRSLPGVPLGRLCPPEYQYSRYGTSYKVVTATMSWAYANMTCSSELGLSKFADIIDPDEATHVTWLKKQVNSSFDYFIGGYQKGGAASVQADWLWVACNIAIDTSVWHVGEPSQGVAGKQGCTQFWRNYQIGIDDVSCNASVPYICECKSVF